MATPAQSRDTNLGRRHFLIGAAVVGAGLYVGFRVADRRAGGPAADTAPFKPNAFVRIAQDDTVTVIIGKSEMGQGIYTSVARS